MQMGNKKPVLSNQEYSLLLAFLIGLINIYFALVKISTIFALLLTETAMAVTRLKRKNRKDKAKAAVRRQTLKIQNFQPVMKNVDVEEIKKEFQSKEKKA